MKNTEILERIEKLEARNARVEADKSWETSLLRRLSIMTLTYIVVVIYLRFVVHINPWINALVPVLGFFLSTLTLSLLKAFWVNNRNHQSCVVRPLERADKLMLKKIF